MDNDTIRIFAGIGAVALLALVVLRRKSKKKSTEEDE